MSWMFFTFLQQLWMHPKNTNWWNLKFSFLTARWKILTNPRKLLQPMKSLDKCSIIMLNFAIIRFIALHANRLTFLAIRFLLRFFSKFSVIFLSKFTFWLLLKTDSSPWVKEPLRLSQINQLLHERTFWRFRGLISAVAASKRPNNYRASLWSDSRSFLVSREKVVKFQKLLFLGWKCSFL